MAGDRILLIENPARISVNVGRLTIERPQMEKVYVGPADVAVAVLHHHATEVTVAALRILSEAGAAVMVTDSAHMPAALMVPLAANRTAPSRLRLQMKLASTPIPEVLWQSLVKARIATQAATLRGFGLNGALRLERMVEEVEPGDRTHREGQAARHYWSCPVSVDGLALGSQAVIHRARAGRLKRYRARGPVGNRTLVMH